MRPRVRLKHDDPRLVELFRAHCQEGWSRRSFVGKMYLTEKGFARAMKENAEFRKVYDEFKTEKTTPYKGMTYARRKKTRTKLFNGSPI